MVILVCSGERGTVCKGDAEQEEDTSPEPRGDTSPRPSPQSGEGDEEAADFRRNRRGGVSGVAFGGFAGESRALCDRD